MTFTIPQETGVVTEVEKKSGPRIPYCRRLVLLGKVWKNQKSVAVH